MNTDHKNLIQIYNHEKLDKYNQVLQRHMLYFQQFNCILSDITGDKFPLTDQLSRERVKIKFKIIKHNEKNIKDSNVIKMNNKIEKFMKNNYVSNNEMDQTNQFINYRYQNQLKC